MPEDDRIMSCGMRGKYRIYTMVRDRDNADFPKVIATEINIKQKHHKVKPVTDPKVC